jgi:hypothetical protein
LQCYPAGHKTIEQTLAMAMTSGIDSCKGIAKSFIAEAYKRKAGLGSNNYRNNLLFPQY